MPIKVFKNNEYTNNYKLFKNLGFPSYKKFLNIDELKIFYIICPKNEERELDFIFDSLIPFKILHEENLSDYVSSSWYKQQILKLNIAKFIETDIYLILDSDMYLNQSFSYKNMFVLDKVKYHYEPYQEYNTDEYSTNSVWYTQSCKLLSYDVDNLKDKNNLMSVTPQILITRIVKDLLNLKLPLQENFTEFSLYWIYVSKTNQTDLYTMEGNLPLWKHDVKRNILTTDANKLCIRKSFTQPTSYFSVIQGYLNIDIHELVKEAKNQMGTHYDAIFITGSMLVPNRHQAFTPEERLQQTIETIKSIKEKVPNSYCIIIEGCNISDYVKDLYNSYYDHVILCANDKEILPYINHPTNIGHGEMELLKRGVNHILNKILPISTTDYIIKLGGRYTLTHNFVLSNYDKNRYTFKGLIDSTINLPVVYTGLYSIPKNKLLQFLTILESHDSLDKTNMIERMFVEQIPNEDIKYIGTLGLAGMLSYNKTPFDV